MKKRRRKTPNQDVAVIETAFKHQEDEDAVILDIPAPKKASRLASLRNKLHRKVHKEPTDRTSPLTNMPPEQMDAMISYLGVPTAILRSETQAHKAIDLVNYIDGQGDKMSLSGYKELVEEFQEMQKQGLTEEPQYDWEMTLEGDASEQEREAFAELLSVRVQGSKGKIHCAGIRQGSIILSLESTGAAYVSIRLQFLAGLLRVVNGHDIIDITTTKPGFFKRIWRKLSRK